MKDLYSPRYDIVATLPDKEVESYVREHELVMIRVSNRLFVYPAALAALVNKATAETVPCISAFEGVSELAGLILRKLENGEEAIVRISAAGMRKFFSTDVFVQRMHEVKTLMPDAVTLLPAGRYGHVHLFALGPQRSSSAISVTESS